MQRSPMASQGSSHCCTSKLQNIEKTHDIESKIGVEGSMLHKRNTFKKDKFGRQLEKTVTTNTLDRGWHVDRLEDTELFGAQELLQKQTISG